MSPRKIVVPTAETVEVETVNQPTIEGENTTMPTETVIANDTATSDTGIVTLAKIVAFSPDAINAAIEEITQNHAVVDRMVAKGNAKPAIVEGMRESLGITDDLDNDVAKIRAELGGRVAELMPTLTTDQGWDNVLEYIELTELLDAINAARVQLKLLPYTLKVGNTGNTTRATSGKSEGAASAPTKNLTGYMRTGTLKGEKGKYNVEWITSVDHILVRVDGQQVYSGKQGDNSLSKIHNEFVLPAAEISGRESFPKWLVDNGYTDVNAIMLREKPTA